MSRPVVVHLLPALFEPVDLRGGVAIVMDVLRATSTIIHALSERATSVIPCGEIDEARRLAAATAPGTFLLGGERCGVKISGFDLGNSPTEYTAAVVAGKSVIFTTTNGTRALIRSKEARRVLLGALSNQRAVVQALEAETGPVHLVCAGTDGRVTLEDVLCAGAIARGMEQAVSDADLSDDATQLALTLIDWCGEGSGRVKTDRVMATFRRSQGGRNLIACGLEVDLAACAEVDKFDIVPELSHVPWEIRAPRQSS